MGGAGAISTGSYESQGRSVPVDICVGSGSGRRPAIVIVHGTRGTNPPWGEYFRALGGRLAEAGFTVFIPHYFAATGTPPATSVEGDALVMRSVATHRDDWIDALGDCLAFAALRPEARGSGFGLLGFSLGGHLALRLAQQERSRVAAAVSFYAPINQPPFAGVGAAIDRLPPLQIHHGKQDGPPVSPAESRALEALLVAAGKVKGRDYELYFYEGQGHGFTGQSRRKAEARTIDFFRRRLAQPQ